MTASVALPTDLPMLVRSDLLGELTIAATDVFAFPEGLLGFPECRQFALLSAAREGMYWLQSMEYSALAFLLVDPFLFFPEYSVDLGPMDLAELQASTPADVLILSIVTLPHGPNDASTVNLQGPLAFGLRGRVAKQIAIAGTEYGVRCPIDLGSAGRK